MKKLICCFLIAVLVFNCTAAFAKNNMTLTQYGDDKNYTEVMVKANNIKKNSDGSITFNGDDTKITYVIDDDTDIYENSTYAAYEDKFLTGEYIFIDFYALKSETEKGGTVHVAAVNSLAKGVVNFTSETNAASNLIDMGIITGDLTGDLRYEDAVTRAEMAAIVCRLQAMGEAPETNEPVFSDVPAEYWASGYIKAAHDAGIINGDEDGSFRPNDEVNYAEALKMIVCLLGFEPYAADNGGYPYGYITTALRRSLIDDIYFEPDDPCSRGDVMIFAYKALDTPIMGRQTYGSPGSYVIFDGTLGTPYQTLRTAMFGK